MSEHSRFHASRAVVRILLLPACVSPLAWAQLSAKAGEVRHELRQTPRFEVGDRAISSETGAVSTVVTGEGGKVLQQNSGNTTKRVDYQVIEVDRMGRPVALKVTIVAATEKARRVLPQPGESSVTIRRAHFVARRQGRRFRADPATLVAADDKLDEAQQGLLQKLYDVSFPAYPEAEALLMPVEAVAVGATWRPTRQALAEWIRSSPGAEEMKGKVLSASFKLVSVADQVALVHGKLRLQASTETDTFVMPTTVTARIDLRSGRWVGQAAGMSMSLDLSGAKVGTEFKKQRSAVFVAGKAGAAAGRPKGGKVTLSFFASESGRVVRGKTRLRTGRKRPAVFADLPADRSVTLVFYPDSRRGVVAEEVTLDPGRLGRAKVRCFYYAKSNPVTIQGMGAMPKGALPLNQRARCGMVAAILDGARRIVEPAGLDVREDRLDKTVLTFGAFDLYGLRLVARTKTVGDTAADDRIMADMPFGPGWKRSSISTQDFVVSEPAKVDKFGYANELLAFLEDKGFEVTEKRVGRDGICSVTLRAAGQVAFGMD